jgi:hypothetical protein
MFRILRFLLFGDNTDTTDKLQPVVENESDARAEYQNPIEHSSVFEVTVPSNGRAIFRLCMCMRNANSLGQKSKSDVIIRVAHTI